MMSHHFISLKNKHPLPIQKLAAMPTTRYSKWGYGYNFTEFNTVPGGQTTKRDDHFQRDHQNLNRLREN